jgi:lipoprotein-releasing system permease protein
VAGGIQVYIDDPNHAEEALVAIGESMDYDLYIEKTSDTFVQVFEWLGLVNRQVIILLGIILTVVCVNMISVVLILVMERVQMVGMLKALGARDRVIRSVFVYSGIRLIVRGLLYGNILGLGVCLLQDRYKFMKLNAHDYYMSYVPVGWSVETVLILNILVFAVVTVVLLLPTAVVSRIRPIRAIRFD